MTGGNDARRLAWRGSGGALPGRDSNWYGQRIVAGGGFSLLMSQFGLFPAGGTATGLPFARMCIAVVVISVSAG